MFQAQSINSVDARVAQRILNVLKLWRLAALEFTTIANQEPLKHVAKKCHVLPDSST